MKNIAFEAEFSAEQLKIISSLAAKTGLCEQTVRILYGRGVDTADKIKAFIKPSKERFLNAFLMSGMQEAVRLIQRARDEEWSVAVFGDYDADGICASTVLYRVLREYGVEAYVYVPERRNGYGLSVEAIDEVFEECFPQLIITVDCGISNAAEVEYIKEQGAEVIVTDHHELPEVLPDCICINPKISDNYPYDNLCGAGVAFKVGCALLGKEAYKYLDFVAIATVADSVPLMGENRDIVAEGLNLINSRPRKNYANFINRTGEKITAQTLAFSVAPKINAAGRMGDARAALTLFLSDDESEIYEGSVKLTEYNLERQKYCDELYLSAKQKIKKKGADGRVILLWDENWNTGFVGIVAARLAEEYCRPTLLFVKNGDILKGSVRSVDGINIFEALKSCSHLITEFGGHSQAAGVNIEEDKLEKLEASLNGYLQTHYSQQAFTPTYYINGEVSSPYPEKFIRELELLEPFGVGNRKPIFALNAKVCQVRHSKFGSAHLTMKCGGQDFIYFSGKKHEKLLKTCIDKRIVFDYSITTFRGKEQIKGYVRDVVYGGDMQLARNQTAFNTLELISGKKVSVSVKSISAEEAQSAIECCPEYGTVFIALDPQTLDKFDIGNLEVNLFTLSAACLSSVVIVSPQPDCDLSEYERIIFLDNPRRITLSSIDGKKVEVCSAINGISCLNSLTSDREELLSAFKVISNNCEGVLFNDLEECAQSGCFASPPLQTLFAIHVFIELGLLNYEEGKIFVKRGVKTQLTSSGLYNFIAEYENDNR